MDFANFFRQATGQAENKGPFPYQCRLALGADLPELVRAPTGAGKTAAAILGWLWRRRFADEPTRRATPRRLVYCLPMRVLVEQTHAAAVGWLDRLGISDGQPGNTQPPIAVHLLMGGEESTRWDLFPERDAILIGTQDMLLSRALNRGYAASRFHWPIDFGLLNNDCLWVFDEPQLMGNGVATSAQLAGLRAALTTFGPCPSMWMSATLEPSWLETIDFRDRSSGRTLELQDDDHADSRLSRRMTAAKTLAPLGVNVTKPEDPKEAAAVAQKIREAHQAETQTLVVLNTVGRAKLVYQALQKLGHPADKLLLIHSRFRPHEREDRNRLLQARGDEAKNRIIVATQVVEAGVDISSRTLITELAPWASIVQRIGRCNRTGADGTADDPARVFWIDLDEKSALPYMEEDLSTARPLLEKLESRDVSSGALGCFKRDEGIVLPLPHTHVLRKRDLLGLFDTTPDLSGNDVDVKPYVRGDDPDLDVQVFWRRWEGNSPPAEEPRPRRSELCNVPVGQLRSFLTGEAIGFVWDYLERRWARLDLRQLRPGLIILLSTQAGGYSREFGWTGERRPPVEPLPRDELPELPEDATNSDSNSETPIPRTIAAHTESVYRAVERILQELPALTDEDRLNLLRAARWHDAGKAHEEFREAMIRLNGEPPAGHHWAKSGAGGRLNYKRKHFRHELASALAILQHHPEWPFEVAYLAATHHGKVRLGIRSLPGEIPPDDTELPFALGIVHGNVLPAVDLGGETSPETTLDLSPMLLGGESSWTARALHLRNSLGPFRLAYLEAILRAADQWVSNQEREGSEP